MRPQHPYDDRSGRVWWTPQEWTEATGRPRGELHAAWEAGSIQRRGWSMGESPRGSQIMQYEYDVTELLPTD